MVMELQQASKLVPHNATLIQIHSVKHLHIGLGLSSKIPQELGIEKQLHHSELFTGES